jgi:hypothetical protein
MIGDVLLRDSDEARELEGGARAFAQVAEKGLTDGRRALRRRALASQRGHGPRVSHLVPTGP